MTAPRRKYLPPAKDIDGGGRDEVSGQQPVTNLTLFTDVSKTSWKELKYLIIYAYKLTIIEYLFVCMIHVWEICSVLFDTFFCFWQVGCNYDYVDITLKLWKKLYMNKDKL